MTGETLFNQYPIVPNIWDEMMSAQGIRQQYHSIYETGKELHLDELLQKHKLAAELFMSQGITFTVYSENEGIERIFPFDIIPRIITGSEWDHIEKGINKG